MVYAVLRGLPRQILVFNSALDLGARWIVAVGLSLGLVSFDDVPAIVMNRSLQHVTARYQGAGSQTMLFIRAIDAVTDDCRGDSKSTPPIPSRIRTSPTSRMSASSWWSPRSCPGQDSATDREAFFIPVPPSWPSSF